MNKYLRYYGEFVSIQGAVYRCELWQDAEQAFSPIGELTFDGDEPLTIEWDEKAKEETICSSSATLNIISPGDRTYVDLYTIPPGNIRLDVYRDNTLYWSGTLDPEFYEEPYESLKDYTVQLVFSDFGCFDRIDYKLSGMQSLKNIVEYALACSKIKYSGIDYSTYASTTFPGEDAEQADISALAVRSDDFVDEEGKAEKLEDVVDGILQPLSLRMVQKCGKIFIYDLNGLYNEATRKQVQWSADEQTLSVDKVASKVEVNFSPYSAGDKLFKEVEYTGKYSPSVVNLHRTYGFDDLKYGRYYSFYPNNDGAGNSGIIDYANVSFTIFTSKTEGKGLAYIDENTRYFHIEKLLGGESCDGVLAGMCLPRHFHQSDDDAAFGYVKPFSKGENVVLMRTYRSFIPAIAEEDAKNYWLKFTLEMLLDGRYNPYTEGGGNCEGNDDMLKTHIGWCFVPFSATIYDADGNALCHYDNHRVTISSAVGYPPKFFGTWKDGKGQFGDAWLVYCNYENLDNDSGIRGWKTNRHNIGRPEWGLEHIFFNADYCSSTGKFIITDSFKSLPDGEFAPYPPKGGWLEIEVYKGARIFDYRTLIYHHFPGYPDLVFDVSLKGEALWEHLFTKTYRFDQKDMKRKFRWYAFKAPQAEIVNANLIFNTAELDDITYSGWINRDAKEDISIDTICGTADDVNPSARGVLCRADNNEQITELCRAGHQDHPENLLIGTLFSQYAARHTKLSGEAEIDPSADLILYTDRAQESDMAFIALGESQNCQAGTTEITLVELSPDQYEAIIPVEDDE